MNAVVAGATPRTGSRADRLLAALPVLVLYLGVAALYVWQGSRHATPWLFSDEIEYTEIARGIAETGTPERRGVAYWGTGLYPWLTAPFWLIDDVGSAYSAIKSAQALVMALAVFPAYLLARMLVSRPWALLAAAGAGIAPAFVYAPMLMQEPFAYAFATLAFLLIAKALAERTRWTIAAAVVASLVAPLMRDQLVLGPLVLVSASLLVAWQGERARAWRAGWRWGHWLALTGALLVGVVAFLAILTRRSSEFAVARDKPGELLDQMANAIAVFAAGVGVLPFVAALALVVLPRGVARDRPIVAFHAVLVTALAGFAAYTGVKGVYSTVAFEPRILERNLIYLTPLCWIALALLLRLRTVSIPALAFSAVATCAAFLVTEYPLTISIYGDAPGAAILAEMRDSWQWEQAEVEKVLIAMLAASVLVLLLPMVVKRWRPWVTAGAAALALGAVAWSLTAEVIAARKSNDVAEAFAARLPAPHDWIDRVTGGSSATYIGQKITDANIVWSTEFWNRSLRRVWSVDGTAPGPGPTLTPDVLSTDGRLQKDPGFRWAIGDFGVDLVGKVVAQQGRMRLYELDGPLRLERSLRGIFDDGWVGSTAETDEVTAHYSRFSTPGNKTGTILVTVGRKGWCSDNDVRSNVLIEVGTLALGPDRNGVLDKATERRGWTVEACAQRTFPIPTPKPPWHARVTISPTFQPHELDPNSSDRRWFGAQVGLDWVPDDS